MPNQESDLMDPGFWSDPSNFVLQQQQQAQYLAGQAQEGDPKAAARAVDLEDTTKVPASIISLDQKNFEAEHKAAITRALLKDNQYLTDYANSHPMAATVSKNDWVNLDAASKAIQQFGANPITGFIAKQFQAQLKGFREGFGTEPIGSWEDAPDIKKFQTDYPNLWNFIKSQVYEAGDIGSLFNRTFAGGLGALNASITQAGQQFGMSEQQATQFSRGILGVVESELARTGAEIPPHVGPMVAGVGDRLKSHIDAGKIPPVGADPVFDRVHAEVAKHEMDNLDEAFKAAHATDTMELSPQSFERFLDVHPQLRDRVAGIDLEGIEKLYPEGKLPELDDGVLGNIPGIRQKIEAARTDGGDVEVPVKQLVMASPEAYKDLHDFIRTYPEGMTLKEAGELPEVMAHEPIPEMQARTPAKVGPEWQNQRRVVEDVPIEWLKKLPGNLLREDIGPLAEDIQKNGLKEPLIINVGKESRTAQLGEGNHRLAAMEQLGYTHAPARVIVGNEWGSAKMPEGTLDADLVPEKGKYFSGDAKPSEVFKSLQGKTIAARPPEMAAVDAVRRGAGLTVRPVDYRPVIPKPEAVRPVTVEIAGEKHETHEFDAREALKMVDENQLTGISKALFEFMGNRLETMAGDTPIIMLEEPQFRKLNKEMNVNEDVPAFYLPHRHEIYMRSDLVRGEWGHEIASRVLYHEVTHAASSKALDSFPQYDAIMKRFMDETDAHLTKHDPKARDDHSYAFKNTHEFLAEAFSKPTFQEALARIPISKELAKDLQLDHPGRTLWDGFRQILKVMLERLVGKSMPDSILDGLLHLGPTMEEAQKRVGLMAGAGLRPLPAEPLTPKTLGITKKEHERLLELVAQEAERDLEYQAKVAERNERVKQTKDWKENEEKVRDTVATELRTRPDIAVDQLLREGQLYGVKIRRVRLEEAGLTDEQMSMLSPEHYGKNGIDPDFIANQFGYHSRDAMINQLIRLESERRREGLTPTAHFNKLRDVETERRMRAQFGKLEENILAEAKEHALSDTTMDRLHEEYYRVGLETGQTPLTKEAIADRATEIMRGKIVKEINSDKILADIGRVQKKIQKELTVGSPSEAYRLMQERQLLTHQAKQALKYEKERTKSDNLFDKTEKRVIKGVKEEFTNWIHTQMIKGDVKVKRTPEDLAERISKMPDPDFLSFAKKQDSVYGRPMIFSENIFNPAWRKAQDSMTLDEWRDWSGAIQTLYNYGKDAEKFELEGKQREWETHREHLIAQAEREKFTKPTPYSPNKSRLKGLVGDANRIYHTLIWLESVWNRADHGNPYGLFKRSFSYPSSAAVNQLSAWVKEFSEDLAKLKVFDVNLKQKVEPIFKHPYTGELIRLNRENARKIVGYMGTKSGEDKLIRGYMLGKEYSPEEYDMARQQLRTWLEKNTDKKDWDFWEGMGKINEGIFGKYEKMVTNVGAVPAQRERLNPINIHGKDYGGWYTKLSYDSEVEGTSHKLQDMPIDPEDAIGDSGFFRQVSTPRSHEKARTGYAGPLYLKMDRDAAQMTNVLRDAAIRPFIINAAKAFRDPVFRDAITRYMGPHVKEMLGPYLESVAGMGPRMSRAGAVLDKAIEYFSRNTVARLIGWNIHTIEKHTLSAAANSLAEVGLVPFVREALNLGRTGDLHPTLSNREFALRQSQELQRRMMNSLETFGGQFESLRGARNSWRNWLAEKGAAPIGFFDLASAVPTWTARYKASIVEQIAKTGDVDYGLAESVADYAVRKAHGSSAISTRPEAMRGKALGRTMTRLYGFFNSMLQRNYEAAWRTKAGLSEVLTSGKRAQGAEDLGKAVKLMVSANIIPALVEEWVTPLPASPDEDWSGWTARMLLMGTSGMIPGVRELVHAWLGGFPSSLGILDTGMRDIYEGMRRLADPAKAFDDEHGGKTIKELNAVFGTLTGWSNDEIGRLAKWGWDATHDNKETPENLSEHIRSMATGHPRPKEEK